MKAKIEDVLSKALGVVWLATFSIASVTALVAIVKLFLKVVGVM